MIQTWLRVSLIFFYAAKVFMLGIFLWCGGTFATHHLCLLEIDHCYTAVKIEFPLGGERWEKESVAQHFVYVLRTLSVYEQFILAEYFFPDTLFFQSRWKLNPCIRNVWKLLKKIRIRYFGDFPTSCHHMRTICFFRKEACFLNPP